MIVTSPNHEGVDGMDCEEVWMWIAESAILLMCPPYQGDSQCLPDRKAHSGALYLSPMISLRNSWAIGLRYVPEIARRLYHCHDLGEPFDFLTWFEYAPTDGEVFEELVGT